MVGMDIMDMVRDLLRLNLDMAMVMDMVLLLSMSPRLTMDMDTTLPSTPTGTILDMDMARGLLSQDMVMLSATTTEAPRVFMDIMEVMDMVVIMARDLLSQDIMVVPALLSTRAVLTTMDLMAMVSTTMARGLLMLDTMAMDMPMVAAATSRLTGHTLPMVSVLLTLTKH